MILILGGTTEGRMAVKTLEEAGQPFFYSTKGDEQEVHLHHGVRLHGGMDEACMEEFCRQHGVRLLVDAAHPFAEQLHQTVLHVSQQLSIGVIRFERIFPERDREGIVWCNGYPDAIRKVKEAGITRLLVLTGVQSIGKLKPLWQDGLLCHCRILDRESSRQLARKQGFPDSRLCYYHAGEDERLLMRQLQPQAILTKESGLSGGFREKVEAARELGIRIFALCRPETPESFHRVNGEHGLRRAVERLLPEFYPLHSGLTTGTCATAAAVAAVHDLLAPEAGTLMPQEFPVQLPDGETISVQVAERTRASRTATLTEAPLPTARACVVKESGDDPDITNGMLIWAEAAMHPRTPATDGGETTEEGYEIAIRGGEGIGTVTMPGLGLAIGEPAINLTPRQMIRKNVGGLLKRLRVRPEEAAFTITLSVPGGEEIARRTFNPRLGIVGGISIVGTSGIIKPFSSEAFVQSIRKAMEVAIATGAERIVINSGAKSEKFLHRRYPALPLQAFVHYGNFIGETLKIASELGVRELTLGVMVGKAVKLAEGYMDTHSKHVTMNRAFLTELALEARCGEAVVNQIRSINMARELWDILPPEQLPAFCQALLRRCFRHCRPLYPEGRLTLLLISEEGDITECGDNP